MTIKTVITCNACGKREEREYADKKLPSLCFDCEKHPISGVSLWDLTVVKAEPSEDYI